MSETLTRTSMIQRLIAFAKDDSRIVALIDYGSSSEGRADEWSDVDVAVFVRDDEFDEFECDWVAWASQLGHLLLAYVNRIGHAWTVYAATPIPLRVDFAFHRESNLDSVLTFPNAPTSAQSMVLHDATDGKLTQYAQQLVGQSLLPLDAQQTFQKVCGDFWYYCLRTFGKMQRGHLWAARHDFNFIIVGNLLALLRLEVGAIDRWRGASAAVAIEQAISQRRLAQLNACIPDERIASLIEAFIAAARLGYDVCQNIAQAHGWQWSQQLAQRVLSMLETYKVEQSDPQNARVS